MLRIDVTNTKLVQVKSNPCNGSWIFAMVAVEVAHGGGPISSLVKLKTIAPPSASPDCPTTTSNKSSNRELVHATPVAGILQVMVTSSPGKKLYVSLNGVIEPLHKFAMGIPSPAQKFAECAIKI